MALTVLVTIEMFNALNALSENCSLLTVPPWKNMYLVFAILGSFFAHFLILYIKPLDSVFGVAPLTTHDLYLVFLFSFPVILIDEMLKLVSRVYQQRVRTLHASNEKEEAQPLLATNQQWDIENKLL